MTPTNAVQGRMSAPAGTDIFRLRSTAPLLLLLVVAAVLTLVGLRMGNLSAPTRDVTLLPTQLGTWVMQGSEKTDPNHLTLPDAAAKTLSLDSYTQRSYVDRNTGVVIQMLLEYRNLGRGAFNHRPEACYPASGLTLTGRKLVPINYGGNPYQAITSVADGDIGTPKHPFHDHEVLLYWFGTGSRVESSFFKQQVEMAFGRLQPDKNGWAFVRLICECPSSPQSNAAALVAEQDFVRQASPAIIQAISPPAAN